MKEQQIQEEQYTFPYHYLPHLEEGNFRQHAYWSWGYRYLAGMLVARKLCDEEDWSSLLDLGCGDGRFISELSRDGSGRSLLGVDFSERAIALARAMNPCLEYRVADILDDDLDGRQFDVVTLIEVIEHIPPQELDAFVERAVSFVKPGGRLVITVPHRNRPVGEKHFQHFDSSALTALLDDLVDDLRFQPFDFFSRPLDLWFRFIGRTGRYFLITWQPLLDAFFRYYMRRCLFGQDESLCSRIACVGWKPEA
jgi:SAM-dependent methyltransferase